MQNGRAVATRLRLPSSYKFFWWGRFQPANARLRASLRVGFDLDLARLGCFFLGQRDAQHAVLERRGDFFGVEAVGHREAACEVAIAALDAVIARDVVLLFELALAGDGERLVLHPDIDILEIDIR